MNINIIEYQPIIYLHKIKNYNCLL